MLIAALVLATPAPDINEFFPLIPGTRWTYQDQINRYVDVVQEPVEYAGSMATPVATMFEGKTMETIFYRTTKDRVDIAGYQVDKPLSAPVPVFRLDEKRWSFTGSMPWLGDPVPATMKGSATLKGKQEWNGEKRDILEVRLDATFGSEKSTAMVMRQTATYAKGIGMIKMEQSTKVLKNEQKNKVELVQFERGGGGNG